MDAADKFLSEAKEYVELMKVEVSRQNDVGIMFDYSKLDGVASRLLEKYERRLSIENMTLKFFVENKEEPDQDNWVIVRLALLLAAGIQSITRLALVSTDDAFKGMTEELMIDLISGLDEAANREKGSFLTRYLADIEEINNRALLLDVDHGELLEK